MPLLTPNFNLPYPDGSDAPCEFAQDWCNFTTAFQDVLDGFQETVNRTVPAVPVARLELTGPLVITNPGIITFDTLSVDTAAWTDFDADPTAITVDRGGYIYLTALAEVAASGVAASSWTLSILNSAGMQDVHIEQAGATIIGMHIWNMVFNSAITKYQLLMLRSAPGDITVNRASFSIFWHSDTATP